MAKLAAGDTCTETVVADTDGFVLESVGEVVFAFGHGTNKDADALIGTKSVNVVSDSDNLGVETECDFAAVWR